MSNEFTKLLIHDKKLLENSNIPIATVSGTFRQEIEAYYKIKRGSNQEEVLFSRAHFSMALGTAMEAWKTKLDPKKAWLVDPTNYVGDKDWNSVRFTAQIGQTVARVSILQKLKSLIDTKARNSLPFHNAIEQPLLYLFENVHRPILTFHYEAGNVLAGMGKSVVQVVTDPHVREQYLDFAELPTSRFCVFDENTKVSFLEKALLLNKKVDPQRIIVTGPPVDPRIVAARKHKSTHSFEKRPLRLCITTGGLGTNKDEIEDCVRSLAPLLLDRSRKIQVIVYAGVHEDIRESVHEICRKEGIPTSDLTHNNAVMRVIYSPHIIQANELLIQYGFPWADGFITKPSGDMAYDAAAAGCFILTLEPWGEWEQNIRSVFEQRGISRRAVPKNLNLQISTLSSEKVDRDVTWMEMAIGEALSLPELFTHGAKHILEQF